METIQIEIEVKELPSEHKESKNADLTFYAEPENVGLVHALMAMISTWPELLAVIEAVEWVPSPQFVDYCPWCQNWKAYGHKPDCQRQLALAKARGE